MQFSVLALLFAAQMGTAAVSRPDFSCENREAHRDAALVVNAEGRLSIQDSQGQGFSDVEALLADRLGLARPGELTISAIRIDLQPGIAKCTEDLSFVIACEARAATAEVQASGFVNKDGVWGRVQLRVPVELRELVLTSRLVSEGPVERSQQPVTIGLDRVQVLARAVLVSEGRALTLSFSPFFYLPGRSSTVVCLRP